MASRLGDSIAAMRNQMEEGARQLGNATKSTLVSMTKAFGKEHGVVYRDALLYAENHYRGDLGDSVVLLDDMLAETKAYWQQALSKQQRTINRPDRAILYVGTPGRIIKLSRYVEELEADVSKLMAVHKGNGFRAARNLSDNTSMWTHFCMLCHRNAGVPGLSSKQRTVSHGLLWFNTHLPATLQAIQADMLTQGYLNGGNVMVFSQVAGVCERGCVVECMRCNRPLNLNFDPIEISTIRAEKVCRACAKFSLALVEPPKFNRGDLRRMKKNLGSLPGGVAE